MDNLGLYIHIPFCLRKCYYCDFHSYSGLEHLYSDYADALCREIRNRSQEFSEGCVDTVYIGGGTPGILPTQLLEKIISSLNDCFYFTSDIEFTIETNPGIKEFINKKNLKRLKTAGINRLSFGVQAFDDKLLEAVGRVHTASDGVEAVRQAHEAGFDNINVDLMYGLAGQSVDRLQYSLSKAVELGVNHISVYGLKVEENTLLAKMLEKGILSLPDENTETHMYDLMIDYLTGASYSRYEISNFARAGYVCRHNLKYWEYSPYLGLGVAAHSFINGERMGNTVSVYEYLKKIGSGESPVWMSDEISLQDKMAEFIFLALRTSQGLNYERFNNYFGNDFLKNYSPIVKDLISQGLLAEEDRRIFLTRLGMKFGNQVFQKFLPE